MKILDSIIKNIDEKSTSELLNGFVDLYYELKEKEKKDSNYTKKLLLTYFGSSIIISSILIQYISILLDYQDSFSIIKCFTAWLSPMGVVVFLLILFINAKVSFRFYRSHKKDYYTDREGNFDISKKAIYGNAHWQTYDEMKECLNMSSNIDDIKDEILGINEKGEYCSIRTDKRIISVKNKVIFGTPGTGKSASIIENDILQCIRREESAIITDSKGDLYRKLSQKARDAGYIVRVLNVKANELRNSDGFNLTKYLENGDTATAEILANAIIENCGDGKHDYWENNELNGYMALLLYISMSESLKKTGRNNLAEMYRMCTTKSVAELEEMFDQIEDEESPAKLAFNIFKVCKPDVKGQILNGMGIKLKWLINQDARKIVSTDEIDLILPMQKKCMYFVVIPDTNKAYNIIANLFFNLMLIKQCEYHDSLPDEAKKKSTFVNYILDEFKSTGSIKNFDNTIATVRSRRMGITIVLQTIGQLQDMYPEGSGKVYQTIMGCIPTKILLRGGDEETCKMFQEMCGEQTRRVRQARYKEDKDRIVRDHNEVMQSEGFAKAYLLPVAEAMKISDDILIACIAGQEPLKLRKFISDTNPYMANYVEKLPSRHKPRWRKKMEDEERERQLRKMMEEEALRNQMINNPEDKEEESTEESEEESKEENVNKETNKTDNKEGVNKNNNSYNNPIPPQNKEDNQHKEEKQEKSQQNNWERKPTSSESNPINPAAGTRFKGFKRA